MVPLAPLLDCTMQACYFFVDVVVIRKTVLVVSPYTAPDVTAAVLTF